MIGLCALHRHSADIPSDTSYPLKVNTKQKTYGSYQTLDRSRPLQLQSWLDQPERKKHESTGSIDVRKFTT